MKPKIIPTLTREQFENEMAFAQRNYFFPTIEDFMHNMNKRIAFLKSLEFTANRSGVFSVTERFREDFVSRND